MRFLVPGVNSWWVFYFLFFGSLAGIRIGDIWYLYVFQPVVHYVMVFTKMFDKGIGIEHNL